MTTEVGPKCHWSCAGLYDTASGLATCTDTAAKDCLKCVAGSYLKDATDGCVTCGNYCEECNSSGTCTRWAFTYGDASGSKDPQSSVYNLNSRER